MSERVTLPLRRSELAIAELGEMTVKGLEPRELAERGWEKRRRDHGAAPAADPGGE